MKIRIIGSGSMWTSYNSASYMIDDNILVDIPNGMCKNLFKLGINPRLIEHVLITHFHGDHYFDIPFYFLLKSRGDNGNINIYCSKEGKRKIQKLLQLAFPNSKKEIKESINLKYTYTESFKVNDYTVKKYLMDHGNMKPVYGYFFSKDNICVGFTGDTSLCKSVEILSSKCKYLFCDCMLMNGNGKHMGIDNISYLSQIYPNCTFVVSHLDDETRQKLEKMKIKNIVVPEDGQIIKVS